MKKNYRTGPRHSPPGMPPEGFPPGYVPQTPEEAAYLGKEWVGLQSGYKRPNRNHPGSAYSPKSSGLRIRRGR
jgi:hypothetical protein